MLLLAVVLFSSFILTLFSASLFLVEKDSLAAESADAYVDVGINIPADISISTNADTAGKLDINIPTPTDAGTQGHATLAINVATNNITGYTLTMNAKTTDTALNKTSPAASIPSTSALPNSAAALGNNTWGYILGASTSAFVRIPPLPTSPSEFPDELKKTAAPAHISETLVTFGAKVNLSSPAGVYTNIMVFTAITNYVPTKHTVTFDPGTQGTFTPKSILYSTAIPLPPPRQSQAILAGLSMVGNQHYNQQ